MNHFNFLTWFQSIKRNDTCLFKVFKAFYLIVLSYILSGLWATITLSIFGEQVFTKSFMSFTRLAVKRLLIQSTISCSLLALNGIIHFQCVHACLSESIFTACFCGKFLQATVIFVNFQNSFNLPRGKNLEHGPYCKKLDRLRVCA